MNQSLGEATNPDRIALLERAIARADILPPELRATLRCELAIELIYTGDVIRRAELSDAAEVLQPKIADPVERYLVGLLIDRKMPWSTKTSSRLRRRLDEYPDHKLVLAHGEPTVCDGALQNEWFSSLVLRERDRARAGVAALTALAVVTRHPLIEPPTEQKSFCPRSHAAPLWSGVATAAAAGPLASRCATDRRFVCCQQAGWHAPSGGCAQIRLR